MIHAHQFTNGTRCRGTLIPYAVRRHLISGWVRCTECGLVGIPIPLPKKGGGRRALHPSGV